MKLNININGHSRSDLELALQEVQRLVSEGFLSGTDENDTADYSFEVKGTEITEYAVEVNEGDDLKERYGTFDEADEASRNEPVGNVVGLSEAGDIIARGSEYLVDPDPNADLTRIVHFESDSEDDYCQLYSIPESMSDDEAQRQVEIARSEYLSDYSAWSETDGDTDSPALSDYMEKRGFACCDLIIDG